MSPASAEAAVALPYPPDGPDDVHAAAARCGRVASLVDRLADDLAHDRWLLHGSWAGPAATACGAEMSAATRLVRTLTEPLHRSGGLLDSHAQVVAEARSRVDALRQEYDDVVAAARRHTDRLLADSDLAGPMRRLELEEAQDARTYRLAAVHRRHQAELERVAEHARLTARRVRHAAASVVSAARAAGDRWGRTRACCAGRLPLLAAIRAAAGVGCTPPPAGSAPGWCWPGGPR